jgi:hypothetical protein
MKNHLNKVLVTLLTLGVASQADAYTYSFSNHTNKTVAIGMKYQGINEPLERRTIAPNTRAQFRPGDPDISSRKAGFVVDKFYYMQDPILSNWLRKVGGAFNPGNINNAPWKALSVTWVPSERYNVAIELAEAVGNFTETAAKSGIKAGAAYATGGASLAADAAKDVVESTAKKIASADTVKELADGDYSLGKFFAAIGKNIGYSFVKSRHIDIVEDEEGNLKFLTLLSK